MRIKGFSLFTLCVILTALPGCDNVHWGGMEVELRAPEPPPTAFVEPEAEDEGRPPEPIRLGPLVYLAERAGSEARLLPVAEWRDGEYHPLPDEEETPGFIERFPLERWEEHTEFVLLHQGARAGTLITDGSVDRDESTCRVRPEGRGRLELRPEASGVQRFVALRREDVESGGIPSPALRSAAFPSQFTAANLREDALSLGRYLIPRAEIPWPPSIPGILSDQRQVSGDLMAATFIFADEPEVGRTMPTSYSFLTVAERGEDGWEPRWLWFQQGSDGKAVSRVLAAGSVSRHDRPDIILEVFGEEARGLAVLGARGDDWALVYRDPCGPEPASGAARAWP